MKKFKVINGGKITEQEIRDRNERIVKKHLVIKLLILLTNQLKGVLKLIMMLRTKYNSR